MMKALRKGNAGFAKVFAAAASRAYGQPAQVVDVNAAVEGNGTLRVEFINVAGLSEA